MAGRSEGQTHAERARAHFGRAERSLSAYRILGDPRGDGVTATVCRTSDRLVPAGHFHRTGSLDAWTACCRLRHEETPVFESGEDCGVVTEHLDVLLAGNPAELSGRIGFAAGHPVIEIRDRCGDCRSTAPTV